MELVLRTHNRRVKKKVDRDHTWYDSSTGDSYYGRGGIMNFHYDTKSRRMIPYLIDVENWVTENSYNDMKKWLEDNEDIYGISLINDIPRHQIVLDIRAEDFDAITADLYNHKITYDYDEKEMQKELKRS